MALRRSKTPASATRGGATSGAATARGGAGGSLIAAGMVLKGDCETDGALRVDGQVTGNVRAGQLTIGPKGRVGGDASGPDNDGGPDRTVLIEGRVAGAVRAPRVEVARGGEVGGGMNVKEAVIRGRVVGGIVTEQRLLLEETAVVEGDVTALRLGLKEGGQVFGAIRIGRAPSEAPPPGES